MRALLSVVSIPVCPCRLSRYYIPFAFQNSTAAGIVAALRAVTHIPSSTRSPFSATTFYSCQYRQFGTMTNQTDTTTTNSTSSCRHPRVEVLSSNIEKPELDDRSYRLIRLLDNKLEALLVHDPKTDKASAAMDVHVGHLSDPKDFPGLAHALEHCLFLGKPFIHTLT